MAEKKISLTRYNEEKQIQLNNNFVINYENSLNPAQYEGASAIDGAYLIIAGAGTGKTRTLTYRVARLIELGYDPKSILLLTFTRKAANEMMSRAEGLLDSRCGKIQGGTFHSFANLTLRKYNKAAGVDPSFTILDQADSEDVINLIRTQSGLNTKDKRFPNKQTLNSLYSLSVNTGKTIKEILEVNYPHFIMHLEKIVEMQRIFDSYKRDNNLLDYDDLLVYLRNFLLSRNDAAKNLLSKINFVMVDEYQDTNKLQAEIVQGLAQDKNNIMAVGDDSQSIYSFRGADFKNIMDFPNLFKNVKVIKLEENFRSTQPILNFANYVIETSVHKYSKFLYTRKVGGELPVIIKTPNDNYQSKIIVEQILELREQGVPLNDIAILFRSSYHSFDLELELTKANIPFMKFGGLKFVEAAHIKDVVAFLRIAENPKDFVSWYRVLLLHEGIGPRTAQRILDELSLGHLNIRRHPDEFDAKKYKDKLYTLFELLYYLHNKPAEPSTKLERILNYYIPLFNSKYDDYNKRIKDLEVFQVIVQKYKSVDTLLADLAIDPVLDSVVDNEAEDKEDEQLVLSTIHSAKGLEWHSVFILNLLEGFFPSSRALDSIDSVEEERRLMYVASTRAKQNLYLTYPVQIFQRFDGSSLAKPSRFITNTDDELTQKWVLEP